MRIAIITFSYPPQTGGVAEVARVQAQGFAARGHHVTVVTQSDPARDPKALPPGVGLRDFAVSGGFQWGHTYHGDIAPFQSCLIDLPVDLMLFHGWQNWATDVALPVLPRCRAPKILLSHGFDAHLWHRHAAFPWGLGQWLRSQPYARRLPGMLQAFDRLVFLSNRQDPGRFHDHRLAARICPHKVRVIPNGVHLAQFQNAHPDFRTAHDIRTSHLVLNVANYCDRKNQLATLRDFMAGNFADATLVFIGGEFNAYHAALVRYYEAHRARHPHARVLFLENPPKETIYAAYQAATVFVLSARQETQPLAILDAMAARVPFLSTDTGCVREFPGGRIVPPGPRMTEALRALLNDANLRQQLGTAGHAACVDKYDWDRVLDAYEKLFAELMG